MCYYWYQFVRFWACMPFNIVLRFYANISILVSLCLSLQIDVDWCWLILIDADCWLILSNADGCCFSLIDAQIMLTSFLFVEASLCPILDTVLFNHFSGSQKLILKDEFDTKTLKCWHFSVNLWKWVHSTMKLPNCWAARVKRMLCS